MRTQQNKVKVVTSLSAGTCSLAATEPLVKLLKRNSAIGRQKKNINLKHTVDRKIFIIKIFLLTTFSDEN